MADEKCNRILEGLIVNDEGELVLDESFRGHLDDCSDCRETYERIMAAKNEDVPDYVPGAMQRIRQLEQLEVDEVSSSWISRLKSIFTLRIVVPAAISLAIVVLLINFGVGRFQRRDTTENQLVSITSVSQDIGSIERQKNEKIDKLIGNLISNGLEDS